MKAIFIGTVLVMAASWHLRKQLPNSENLSPLLYEAPIQANYTPANRPEIFDIDYMGSTYTIKPQANYTLYGLIVSMNNPTGLGDSYHDEKSFDTKDFCVIWGDNLDANKYKKVKFWNVSWTCNWRYKTDIGWDNQKVSNNHLITAHQHIRDQIEDIKVGDQIKLEGQLVNYVDSKTGFERKTSMTRADHGNTACEVFLVENLEVLAKQNRIFHHIYKLGWFILLGLVLYLFFGPGPYKR